jgi:hypothetical protein
MVGGVGSGGRCERISVRRAASVLPFAEMKTSVSKPTFVLRVKKEIYIILLLDIYLNGSNQLRCRKKVDICRSCVMHVILNSPTKCLQRLHLKARRPSTKQAKALPLKLKLQILDSDIDANVPR